MNQLNKLEEAIRDLYSSVVKLHDAFPERPFTPDGRMVGDIGEAIAAIRFKIILDKRVGKHWDGYWKDSNGKEHKVQVKATQKDGTYLKKPPHEGIFLVFKIFSNGGHKIIYNGNIMRVWNKLKNQKDNDGKNISLQELEKLNSESDSEKIKIKK